MWNENGWKTSYADYKPKETKTEEPKPKSEGYISVSGSSIIKGFQYDPDTKKLTVDLTSGNTYVYDDIAQYLYDGFKAADSKGSYYNNYIKR